MVGLDAIVGGMEEENRMVREQSKALHRDLFYGKKDGGSGPPEEDNPMRIMAARDVHIHEPAGPAGQPGQPATASPEKGLVAKALPYVAAGLLAGGGLGTAIPWLLGAYNSQTADQPASAEYVDTTTSIGIGGGEPTLEW